MDALGSANIFLFEGFRLDCDRGVLFRLDGSGESELVMLGSRAFDLLRLLAERHGELISQDAIMKQRRVPRDRVAALLISGSFNRHPPSLANPEKERPRPMHAGDPPGDPG
jgi:hypothetical protein